MSPDEANCQVSPPPSPTPTPPMTTPTMPWSPPPPTISCDNVPNFRFVASPSSCTNYYQCIDGTAFLLSCPRGLYFSEIIQACTDPDQANCVIIPPTPTPPPPPPPVSCDGVEDFTFLPSRVSCSEYYQCIDGVAFRLSCPRGLYFSPDALTCMSPNEANCQVSPPPSPTPPMTTPTMPWSPPPPTISCDNVSNFRFVASPISCTNYYQCIDGTAFLLSCPRGLYFSEIIQACDNPANVDCGVTLPTNTPPTSTPPTGTPPPGTTCVGVDDFGLIPSLVSCTEYYQCIDNVAYRVSCPRGYYFSAVLLICTDPGSANCVINPPTPPTTDNPCSGVEDFRSVAHPTSCAFFFQCINEASFLVSCPFGRYFDESMEICLDAEMVECGARTRRPSTTTSVPTDPTGEPDICDGINEEYVGSSLFCEIFFFCVNGNAYPNTCQTGFWFDRVLRLCRPQDEVECTLSTLPTTTEIITTTDNSPIGRCRQAANGTYVSNFMACGEFFVRILNRPSFHRF